MKCKKCGYVHAKFKNGNTRKMCSQKGKGVNKKLVAGATRGLVKGITKGMDYVPGGRQLMSLVNPLLDKGLKQLAGWESGKIRLEQLTPAQRKAHGDAFLKKTKPKRELREKAQRILNRKNRGHWRGRWGPTQEKIMKAGGYRKRKGGYTMLSMSSKW